MSSDPVLHELSEGVLVLTLNRPERLNAWTPELERRYFALLARADRDPAVRAVVVTGAGRGFCAGGDLDDIIEPMPDPAVYGPVDRPKTYPSYLRKPLIAAINGGCAGLGLLQALCCDVRFAEADAKLTTSFARRGVIAEYGISWLLPRLIGRGKALDLLLSARVITGAEGFTIGLIDRLSAPGHGHVLEESVAYARELSRFCSPTAVAAIKRQVREDERGDFATAYGRAEAYLRDAVTWPDLDEGVRSFQARRPPRFPPLR